MTWTQIASEFAWDGSWRDIYIVGSTIDDWQRILDALLDHSPPPLLYIDGAAAPFPPNAKAIFEQRRVSSPLLQVAAGNVVLNCHFFDDEEVEFDLDPREVRDEEDLRAITDFMSRMANATGKATVLTHENTKSAVILTMSPRT